VKKIIHHRDTEDTVFLYEVFSVTSVPQWLFTLLVAILAAARRATRKEKNNVEQLTYH
jgi:hypothetical protein